MIFSLFGGRLGLLHLRDCSVCVCVCVCVCGGGGGSVFGNDYVLEFCEGTYLEM